MSCPELDALVDAARSAGAIGAKMSGTGRGGLMIADAVGGGPGQGEGSIGRKIGAPEVRGRRFPRLIFSSTPRRVDVAASACETLASPLACAAIHGQKCCPPRKLGHLRYVLSDTSRDRGKAWDSAWRSMAERRAAPAGPRQSDDIAKNAAANAALLAPITGKSAHTLLYDDTMAASTLHVAAAAAKDKTKGKKAAGRLLMFAYVAAEALDDAEATSDAHAAARDAVDKLRMAVTNEDGDAASERAREAAAVRLTAAGLGDEMRRRLKRARPGKFALVHQVLEYLYVGGWAALNDDCRVLREQKISRVCSVDTADTPRTLPAFVTHHLHVVCRDDKKNRSQTFPNISFPRRSAAGATRTSTAGPACRGRARPSPPISSGAAPCPPARTTRLSRIGGRSAGDAGFTRRRSGGVVGGRCQEQGEPEDEGDIAPRERQQRLRCRAPRRCAA